MAEDKFTNTTQIHSLTSLGLMVKDLDPQLLKEGQYTHAINSQKQSHDGDMLFIQNEPSNFLCLQLPKKYQLIGHILLKDDRYAIFSTNNTSSEIGIFNINTCTYSTLVNNSCLNFNTTNLIRGVSKENYDCSESIYWCDNLNPNRVLNLENIPYTYTLSNDGCNTKIYSTTLDCDELNIDSIISLPTITLSKANSLGQLRNGSYQASIVYSVKGQNVTNHYSTTTPQQLFSKINANSALEVNISQVDSDFDEFKLYVIATVAQQTTVYEIGTYNINTKKIVVTNVEDKVSVPLSDLFLQKVVYEKSEDVIESANSLIWKSATTIPELNYQQQALKINTEWVAYRVPRNYYRDGGNKAFYMRDEVYGFGIQWFNRKGGFWTPAYHIAGRTSTATDLVPITNNDAFELHVQECERKTKVYTWEIYDTSTGGVSVPAGDNCDEYEVGKGKMSYYESQEKYPDNETLFGTTKCTPIRHHKMPSEDKIPRTVSTDPKGMIILGVRFKDIEHPKDSDGNLITDYTAYRIVRTDRKGNQSIIGKGLLYNLGTYELPVTSGSKIPALYPNYPFNDLRVDPFLSKTPVKTNFTNGKAEVGFNTMGTYSDKTFTFHSPSFSFAKPSFGNELKIESLLYGDSTTTFSEVYGHPMHKIITNVAFTVAILFGIGEAYIATREKKIITTVVENENVHPVIPGPVLPGTGAVFEAALATYNAAVAVCKADPFGGSADACMTAARIGFLTALQVPIAAGGVKHTQTESREETAISSLPGILRVLYDVFLFSFYFQQGVDTALDLIGSFSKYEQYAKQANSHCFYDKQTPSVTNDRRRYISNANYLYPVMQDFEGYRVNNFKRESSVILRLNKSISNPSVVDTSRYTISGKSLCNKDTKSYTATASSYYASIRTPQPSQYGQLESIHYLDTGQPVLVTGSKKYTSPIIFGGDTFLNRFTLKRKMHYFNQTAFNELDGHSFDYSKYYNIPYARYWIDTFKYELTNIISLTNPEFPSAKHSLDCKTANPSGLKGAFIKRDQDFYLFNCGIVDFFVESEYNIDLRESGTELQEKHYDYEDNTNLEELFRHDILHFDNEYRFDKSYLKELEENYIPQQSRYYDLEKAETCYTIYKNRVFWTLPSFREQIRDSWRFYLPNNYYDFSSSAGDVVRMKAIDRTNIIFLMSKSAPYIHQSADVLETGEGIKVQIGDGGLFARAPQPLAVTDTNFGACTSGNAVLNSQYGLLYLSENQGKVFLLIGQKLKDISQEGMSAWFKQNMPSKLLKDFPTYLHKDNPVKGIGYTSGFDSSIDTLYISKKDFKVKDAHKQFITYDESVDKFYYTLNGTSREVKLTNTSYFDDASWTASYNPNLGGWVSFHDWHPTWIMQSENKMVSVLTPLNDYSTFWTHNQMCTSFCKYYNTKYPWEIEYVDNSGQATSTLKSIEYSLEAYEYSNNCYDKHHILDYNFSNVLIHNTEQISGNLRLNIRQKNKISESYAYPRIDSTNQVIDIICTKEEHKYRFNQFWDITRDRGEFSGNTGPLLTTDVSGYRYNINTPEVDYLKNTYQRKKFRHNYNKVYLIKAAEEFKEMKKMIFKFLNVKNTLSPR